MPDPTDDTNPQAPSIDELIATAVAAHINGSPKASKTRDRLIVAVLTMVIGGGSAGAVMTAGQRMFPPHPAVVERLDRIDRAVFAPDGTNRIGALEDGQGDLMGVARETLAIVNQAHPISRQGVPK